MRGLWRISKPLYAAGAASLQSSVSRSSSQGARRFIGFTATRWEPAAANSATTTASDAAAAISDQAKGDAAGVVAEEADLSPPVDLKDVGAETTKVLTIADVLTRREEELSEQGSAAPYFDEWESIPGTHTIQDAIDMMVECNIGSLIVTEDNAGIVGIVTERDVMKKTSPRALAVDQEKPVKEIMSSHIMCIPPTTTVIDALATMTKENIRHLAVVNGEISTAVKKGSVPEEAMRCVLSIKDIVKAYAHFEAQKKTLLLEQGQSSTIAAAATEGTGVEPTTAPSTEAAVAGTAPLEGTEGEAPQQQPPSAPAATPPPTPAVTAATLLKKKHKKIKLILNTRPEDNISVAEAVEEMAKHNFGAVLIVDKEQRVVGIFTERDYLTKVLYPKEDPTRMRVTDACTKKLSCFQIEDSLEKCWTQAANLDFRHFPVIGTMRKDREKELAGVLSIKDIVREISKDYETPSGFRLMEFFKSKMTKEQPPVATTTAAPVSVPAAAAPAAPQAESSSPEATTTASSTTEPATPAASGSGEPSENKEIQPETTSAQKTTGKTE